MERKPPEDPLVPLLAKAEVLGPLSEERALWLARREISARLASLLLRLLEKEGVVTREGVGIRTCYTHEQLATMIGAKRVAISRAMAGLRRVKAVEIKGRRVYIEDQAALQWAAEVGQREA